MLKGQKVIFVISLSFFLSCGGSSHDSAQENDFDSIPSTPEEYIPEIEKTSDENQPAGFYIINVDGTPDIKQAVEKVKNLKSRGHPAGYLWIPDYSSLNTKEMFSIFIGPFVGMDTTIRYLEKCKTDLPNAYGVKVSHEKERITLIGKYDIRVNEKRQLLILTYSRPDDEEEYANNGGEDWGWFTNDVREYFLKHYPDKVYFSGVYYGWLTQTEIKALEQELSLQGFGYVLINGKNKSFVPHDMPHQVIQSACEFFGLTYLENE